MSTLISKNNREFIISALKSGVRIDGRNQLEFRNFQINFDPQFPGNLEFVKGNTRIISNVKSVIEPPFKDRPDQGKINFKIDLSILVENKIVNRNDQRKKESSIIKALERVIKGSK